MEPKTVWTIMDFRFGLPKHVQVLVVFLIITLPETNIAPETLSLEDEFPFGMQFFQVLC